MRVSDLWLGVSSSDLDKSNLIYKCTNLINGKSYIGSTKSSLRTRWVGNNPWTHQYQYSNYPDHHRILYRALRKYGLDNFEISIIQSDFISDQDRLDAEKYWIQNLHTCIYDPLCRGYNMTWGGEDCSHLHTKEVHDRALRTNMKNHNGVFTFNLPHIRRYSQLRSKEVRLLIGEGDECYMLHTPEIKLKAVTNSINSRRSIYGSASAHMMTHNARISAAISRIINKQSSIIESIKSTTGIISLSSYSQYFSSPWTLAKHFDNYKKHEVEILRHPNFNQEFIKIYEEYCNNSST